MKLHQVIQEISRQAYLQTKSSEIYEQESCEVLALDCIRDYYLTTNPDSPLINHYNHGHEEEQWMMMNRIFCDYVSDSLAYELEYDLKLLLEEFFIQFYSSAGQS